MDDSEYISAIREAYDAVASEYAIRRHRLGYGEESPRTLAGVLLEAVREAQPKVSAPEILEVGSGNGAIVAELEMMGGRTTAVELSSAMARLTLEVSPRTNVLVGNILGMTFDSGRFDGIFAGALIHLFPPDDARRVLTLFRKWLNPQGRLFVNTTVHDVCSHGYESKTDYSGNVSRYRSRWTEAAFRALIEDSQLVPIRRFVSVEHDREKQWLAFVCERRPT